LLAQRGRSENQIQFEVNFMALLPSSISLNEIILEERVTLLLSHRFCLRSSFSYRNSKIYEFCLRMSFVCGDAERARTIRERTGQMWMAGKRHSGPVSQLYGMFALKGWIGTIHDDRLGPYSIGLKIIKNFHDWRARVNLSDL